MAYTDPKPLVPAVPMVLVDGATATGVAKSQYFTLPSPGGLHPGSLLLQAVKTAITVLTINLEISLDGGTTFDKLGSTWDAYAGGAIFSTVVAGALYRLNVQTITGTSATVRGVTS